MTEIKVIENADEKMRIARDILEALPDWFAVEEAREQYIQESAHLMMTAAFDENQAVGFLCLKETGEETVELYVTGVLKEYHRRHIGRKLFETAKEIAVNNGYSFIQVKTVAMGMYPEYDDTNRFYLSLGFKQFEVIPEVWGENNPCQIYVMYLKEE